METPKTNIEVRMTIPSQTYIAAAQEIMEGYSKVTWDALKEMEENRVYKYEGPTIPAFWPPCHYGGECTNGR